MPWECRVTQQGRVRACARLLSLLLFETVSRFLGWPQTPAEVNL